MSDGAPEIALVWAMDENRVIGANGGLPWRLPGEMAYFRALTLGKPVIMGRRTFESLPKALPGRTNIVVSRSATFEGPRVQMARSLDEALALGREKAAADGASEVIVMGGAEIYAASLAVADRLYMTVVHGCFDGDTFFPELDPDRWVERRSLWVPADGQNRYAYSLVMLERG